MKTHTSTTQTKRSALVSPSLLWQIACKHLQVILLSLGLFLFAHQAMAVTYNFSDSGVSPALSGCSRTGPGTYTCTSAVTLTGNDSITIAGTTPATINFNSNLTLQFINETTQAKINLGGVANDLNLVVAGTLSLGKKTVVNANVWGGSVNDTGGDVFFGGSINTTTGYVNIGYSSDIVGSITTTSGSIILGDQITVGGSVNSTTGAINFINQSTISGNVTCTSCVFSLSGLLSSTINGDVTVAQLRDNTTNNPGTRYGGSITATSTSSVDAFLRVGTWATVAGSVTAVSNFANNPYVVIGDSSIVQGSVSAIGNVQFADAYVYINASARVVGNVSATAADAFEFARVETGSGVSIGGSVLAIAATPSYGTVFLRAGTVSGSVTSSDNVYNYANVTGCVQSSNPSGAAIRLYSSSSSGGVCCGTGICGVSCVTNLTGRSMPPTCTLSTTPLLSYLMEQNTWNGTTGEVIDSSGNNYHGTAARFSGTALPITEVTTPAIPSSPGTCRYATFNGNQFISVPPNFPDINGTFTISAWIRTTDINTADQRIFVDDQNNNGGYGLSLSDPGPGRLRFFKRSNVSWIYSNIDSGAVIANNQWYFVAVVLEASSAQATMYIYNQSGTLLESRTATFNYIANADSGPASAGGENASSAEKFGFRGNVDELNIFPYAMTATQVNAQRQVVRACSGMNVAAADFNCVAPGTDPNSGRLYTQIATTPFNVDVVALKTGSAGIETSFATSGTKNVTVEFVDATAGSCTTYPVLIPTASQTATFSSADTTPGRKNITTTINNAYKNLRCRVTDNNQTPSLIRCSSDNFAVRPSAFTNVTVTGANADTTGNSETNTPVLKAGAGAFALQANTGLANYNGTPKLDNSKLTAHTGAVRAGTVSGGFNQAVSGSASGDAFKYNEVGYFRLNQNAIYDDDFTAVDSPNDCAAGFSASGGLNACSFGNSAATGFLGRFTPNHFVVAKNAAVSPNPTQTCGNFSYFGQSGLSTAFTIAAQSFDNQVTQNYTGKFARLSLTDWSALGFSATNKPASVNLSGTSSGTWSNGNATVTAQHLLSRPTTPVVPATITMTAKPTDADGVTASSTTAVADASDFRFGRLNFSNAHGSELLPLSFVVEAQYWSTNGAYQRNTLDTCSAVNAQSIVMSNYTKSLNACETSLSGGGTMVSGKTTLTFSKPGAGNSGSVNIAANLDGSTGAGVQTCISGSQVSATGLNLPQFGTTDVTRRATFGVYKSPLIYMRESF